MGKHDREAGSSSGRRRGSVKEEAASPPRRAAPAPFTIAPRPAGQRDRQYLNAEAMTLSVAGDVAIPEMEAEEVMKDALVAALVGQQWSWSCTAPEMAYAAGVYWCPTPPRSPERDASPREEVVQAPASFQPAPAQHGPSAHLWTPPTYVDLVSDDDDTGGQ
ncbi:histone-lysine n-methyltransferase atxr3 [Hordeum vulgare]|nr:histone-lysine n-methyltransferase atxr3 [Hordeum vulgare]